MIRIPLASPDVTEAEIDAVTTVMRTNTLSIGPELEQFESALAQYHSIPFAITVSSGTAALHLAIRALGIGEGDEVIVPSFTFIAVANAVRFEHATPVFVDIDATTLNMDPASAEAAITERTRAMVVVHTFGVPAEMDALATIARKHGIAMIEDACEAIGASFRDQLAGTFGDIATLAFYPNKQMTTGEGGALLTRDASLATRLQALRNQGRYPSSDWLQHTELGYNYRLSEMACALGRVQLARLDAMLEQRATVAQQYDNLLSSIPALERPVLVLPHGTISWFVYVIRVRAHLKAGARDRVMQALQEAGIGCGRYFAPIHQQPAYADYKQAQEARLPMTESIAQRTLALPFFNKISPLEMKEVATVLQQALEDETSSVNYLP